MRVLFVNTPFYRLLGSKYNANSLGLAYTAAVFNELGHDAWIYNADHSDEEYADLKAIFDGGEGYLEYFKDENHPIWREVVDKIFEFKPDMVGYACYTANVPSVKIIAEHVRRESFGLIGQFVGGPHIKLLPEDAGIVARTGFVANLFKTPGLMGCNFEAEELLGIDLRKMDAFPLPERDKLWGVDKANVDLSYLMTSRGCPYRCSFCASPKLWDRKVRFRSPKSVVSEMQIMKNKYGIEEFYILDDTFTIKSKRVNDLLLLMLEEELNVDWKCNTRLDCLTQKTCQLMVDSGCIEAKVGVESGSEKILKQMNKGESKEDMRRGIGFLKSYGIPVTVYLMAGFPGETDEDLKETIEFAKEIEADRYSLSIFAPYFGSQVYSEIEKSLDKYPEQYFYHQSNELIANDLISEDVLKEYLALSELNK